MENSSRMSELKSMLEVEPEDAFLRYALAMELIGVGKGNEAAEELRKITEVTPDYIAAWMQWGQICLKSGMDAEARKIFQTGIEKASAAGDDHAAEEMRGMLSSLD